MAQVVFFSLPLLLSPCAPCWPGLLIHQYVTAKLPTLPVTANTSHLLNPAVFSPPQRGFAVLALRLAGCGPQKMWSPYMDHRGCKVRIQCGLVTSPCAAVTNAGYFPYLWVITSSGKFLPLGGGVTLSGTHSAAASERGRLSTEQQRLWQRP